MRVYGKIMTCLLFVALVSVGMITAADQTGGEEKTYDIFAERLENIPDTAVREDIAKYCGHYDFLSNTSDRYRNFSESVMRVHGRSPQLSPEQEREVAAAAQQQTTPVAQAPSTPANMGMTTATTAAPTPYGYPVYDDDGKTIIAYTDASGKNVVYLVTADGRLISQQDYEQFVRNNHTDGRMHGLIGSLGARGFLLDMAYDDYTEKRDDNIGQRIPGFQPTQRQLEEQEQIKRSRQKEKAKNIAGNVFRLF